MIYASTQILLPKEAAEINDYVSYACKHMRQQLTNAVIENAIKGECIVSIDNSPIKEEDLNRNAVKMTLTCRIQKLVRCKDCALSFKASDGRPVCKRDTQMYRYVAPDFFCGDGKEEEE